MPYRVTYVEFDLFTCTLSEEFSEEVDCVFDELQVATLDWNTCEVGTAWEAIDGSCCGGEGVDLGTSTSTVLDVAEYIAEFTAYNFETCEVEAVECEPVGECPEPSVYTVQGGNCYYDDYTENPYAIDPVFPSTTLYMTFGSIYSLVQNGPIFFTVKAILDAYGVPYRIPMPYVGNGGEGTQTQKYEYLLTSNWTGGASGTPTNPAANAVRVRARCYVNAPYTESSVDYPGCRADVEVSYYSAVLLTTVRGGWGGALPYVNSAGFAPLSGGLFTFHPEPIYIEYSDTVDNGGAGETYRVTNTAAPGGVNNNGTVTVSDGADVPPLEGFHCQPFPAPATLQAVLAGTLATYGADFDGTYTLTWQNGVYANYFAGPGGSTCAIEFHLPTFDIDPSANVYSDLVGPTPSSFMLQTSLSCSPFQWEGGGGVGMTLTVTE